MSRRRDTIETVVQTVAGIFIGFGINLLVLPIMGIPMDVKDATAVTAFYVLASFIRAYMIRRGFRWWENRHAD